MKTGELLQEWRWRIGVIAAVVGLLLSGASSTGTSLAAGTVNLPIQIDVDGDTTPECRTDGDAETRTCSVPVGRPFVVELYVDGIEKLPDHDGDGVHGYSGYAASFEHSPALEFEKRENGAEFFDEEGQPFWPDLAVQCSVGTEPGVVVASCPGWLSTVESTYAGKLMEVDFRCSRSDAAEVAIGRWPTNVQDDVGKAWPVGSDAPEVLTVICTFPWDVDGSGAVTVGDIFAVVSAFGQTVPPAPAGADVNGDGIVSIGDLAAVIGHFGETVP